MSSALEERGQLGVDESLRIIRQVGSALGYAHRHRLLHRDIKPGNVLLGEGGHVKVVDFGLAKRLVDSAFTQHTTTGMTGTPLFMAPELLSGSHATPGTDVYSMAATLYRMITGKHPIEARRLDEWMQLVQSSESTEAIKINPAIPRRISDALADALRRDPKSRPQTVAEFMGMLGLS